MEGQGDCEETAKSSSQAATLSLATYFVLY